MSENWYQNAIFYELYVRAFRDSNVMARATSRSDRKLDYLKDLGVDLSGCCQSTPPVER
jgi:1,4-alpha-glucan branching enzyme